ncbi:MAG: polyprenyl diphosphate synthase [bacterium]
MTEKEKTAISHVAIIPDGNRRWAKERGFLPWIGHQAGIKAFEKILEQWAETKIPYLTFWGGSFDNLTKRPKKEIEFLFKAYDTHFRRLLKDQRIYDDKVKINAYGLWKEILPAETQEVINKCIEKTKDHNQFFLTFLLAYDGVNEMIAGCQKIANLSRNREITVDEKLIKESLWTKDLPSVDLVIRTGCERDPHLSAGFMMWHTAYSQLYFTEVSFPDFSVEEFKKSIGDYSIRERRFGK